VNSIIGRNKIFIKVDPRSFLWLNYLWQLKKEKKPKKKKPRPKRKSQSWSIKQEK
jgi:hypothetical protein